MKPKEVLAFAKENGAKMLDMRFMDFPGLWQHFSVPIGQLEEGNFEDGYGFDGSSIRGWQPINASDMLVIPDPATAKMDPFTPVPTLTMICDIVDPVTRSPYTRDPRNIAKKAEAYLKSTGIGDTAYIGPEAEFFIFDDVRYQSNGYGAFYELDSVEGTWNTGRDEGPNLGYKCRPKEGYFPVPPMDKFQDMRTEMVMVLEQLGIEVEAQHHEVATAQSEIDMKFRPLLQMADQLQWFKYVLKNVAYRHNRTVTFMPKPLFGDNGSGMHTHISIWKGGKPLFAGDKYAGDSQMALYAIGGILKHCRALCAITNPTNNSYKGLLQPEPQRRHPHPDDLELAQGQAHRVPHAGPLLQRLSRLLGRPDGRSRRDPEQDRAGRPAGQEHLRPAARGAGEGALGGRIAGRGARVSQSRPRVPAEGRGVHS
jgi:glutamine synthetase